MKKLFLSSLGIIIVYMVQDLYFKGEINWTPITSLIAVTFIISLFILGFRLYKNPD
jgi:hypothetical protein